MLGTKIETSKRLISKREKNVKLSAIVNERGQTWTWSKKNWTQTVKNKEIDFKKSSVDEFKTSKILISKTKFLTWAQSWMRESEDKIQAKNWIKTVVSRNLQANQIITSKIRFWKKKKNLKVSIMVKERNHATKEITGCLSQNFEKYWRRKHA